MKIVVGILVTALGAVLAAGAQAADTAAAALQAASGSKASGRINFAQDGDLVRVTGEVRGLSPGAHGFHLHEKGDCSAPDAKSAGAHFNPTGSKHGGPSGAPRHAGDFGNITADSSGTAKINLTASGVSVARDKPESVVGKAVVVHAKQDDLKTDPAGDSGDRIACGVVK
jgi:Cu-Zn family superoxide dismutase